MDGAATRDDLIRLEARLYDTDQRLSGMSVLAVQLQEVAKDVARLDKAIEEHRREHADEARSRAGGRRWLFMAILGVIAAIDGPIVTVLLAIHH